MLKTITRNEMTETKSTLVGLHTTGFTGVAFEVCVNEATICIKFLNFDVALVPN